MELGMPCPDRTGSSAERQEIALRFVNHTPPNTSPGDPLCLPILLQILRQWPAQKAEGGLMGRVRVAGGSPEEVSTWVPTLFHQSCLPGAMC